MSGMKPEDVPDDLVRAALAAHCTTCLQTVGRTPYSDHEEEARAMLAGALPLHERQLRERAETAEHDLVRQRDANRDLAKQAMRDMERATKAERALAELRSTLRPEYGLRYPSNKTGEPDEHLRSASDEETARLLAAHGDTIMRRYRNGWEEVPADGQQ